MPVDMWEATLNPPKPEPPQGETVDEAFDRMRADSARRTPLQLLPATARRSRAASRTQRRARLQDDVEHMTEEEVEALEQRLAARPALAGRGGRNASRTRAGGREPRARRDSPHWRRKRFGCWWWRPGLPPHRSY